MMRAVFLLPVLLAGCGDSKPTPAPSPFNTQMAAFTQEARAMIRLWDVGATLTTFRDKLNTVTLALAKVPEPKTREEETRFATARQVLDDLRDMVHYIEVMPHVRKNPTAEANCRKEISKYRSRARKGLQSLEPPAP